MKEINQVCAATMITSSLFVSLLFGYLVAQEPPLPIRDNRWMDANWPGKLPPRNDEPRDFELPNQGRVPKPPKVSEKEIPVNVIQSVASLENASEFIDKYLSYSPKDKGILEGGGLTGKSEEQDQQAGFVISRSSSRKQPPPVFGSNFARQALCTPSETVIELKKESDPLVFYFPTCTRVKRCGGCCRSSLLQCQPSQTQKLSLKVIRAKYSNTRSKPFDYEAIENITVEEHTKCKCQCKITESDCNPLQVYRANECRCECNNQDEVSNCRGSDKFWDSNVCACKCKNYQDQCSTGRKFSEKLCRCIPEAIYNIQEGGGSDFLFGRSGGPLRKRPSGESFSKL